MALVCPPSRIPDTKNFGSDKLRVHAANVPEERCLVKSKRSAIGYLVVKFAALLRNNCVLTTTIITVDAFQNARKNFWTDTWALLKCLERNIKRNNTNVMVALLYRQIKR